MKHTILALCAAVLLAGCASSPDTAPSTEQLVLETSVRIAVRHAIVDNERAAEKARNIRAVAQRLQTFLAEDWTVATLTTEAAEEIDALGLDPLSHADAHDLLRLLAALLEQRVGSGELAPDGVVRVREFVDLVLGALPAV